MEKEEKEFLTQLETLINKFEKFDGDLYRQLEVENFTVLSQTIETKKEIKRLLAERASLVVGTHLAPKLKKIRDNYGYNIDDVVKALGERMGLKISQESEGDQDIVEAIFEDDANTDVALNIFRRRNEVSTIIADQSLPKNLVHHLVKLKQCYALGLFEATIIFCRAVIELGLFEGLRRRNDIRPNEILDDLNLKEYRRRAKRYFTPQTFSEIEKIINLANKTLHEKKDDILVSENQAYHSVKKTYAIIEELFQPNR